MHPVLLVVATNILLRNPNKIRSVPFFVSPWQYRWVVTMPNRRLRIEKRDPPPAIGVCEHCNARFKSSLPYSEADIQSQFDAHKCKLIDSSHLVIIVELGTIPLKGGCSSCKDVHFTAGIDHIGTAQEHHSKLESLFLEHFRKVHMHEDASQKATNA